MDEALLLRGALGGYLLAALGGRRQRAASWLLGTALALHTLALAQRWAVHGHGPFTTLHEILSSSLWSLALIYAACAWRWRELRAAWLAVTPVLALLGLWALLADPGRGHLPPTYATSLLYLHALAGKLYLGLLLVACGVASLPWLRRLRRNPASNVSANDDARSAALAHGFAAAAFVCDSLMLIIGAAWAQDAWGRYWAWDPLESWAFVSWLGLVMALHGQATWRPTTQRFAVWLWLVFALAFLTFFGVPFLSTSPHKGAL